jgi:hypothetical protein
MIMGAAGGCHDVEAAALLFFPGGTWVNLLAEFG